MRPWKKAWRGSVMAFSSASLESIHLSSPICSPCRIGLILGPRGVKYKSHFQRSGPVGSGDVVSSSFVAALGNWVAGDGPAYRRLADAARRAIENGEIGKRRVGKECRSRGSA